MFKCMVSNVQENLVCSLWATREVLSYAEVLLALKAPLGGQTAQVAVVCLCSRATYNNQALDFVVILC